MNKLTDIIQFILQFPAMLACLSLPGDKPAREEKDLRAGLRSSPYGPRKPFPDPPYWVKTSLSMAAQFPSSTISLVWIVGVIKFQGNSGIAKLSFPAPDGQVKAYPDIIFNNEDKNEEYFNLFDKVGIKIWLQVEPGDTDVSTLIDLVLKRYGSHPCVIGFGVDVEWIRWNKNSSNEGTAITDAQAQTWSEKVRSYNPNYQFFLKHWLVERMPPTYRKGFMFLDDSQEFSSLADMIDTFTLWGKAFSPSPVGFQFGYKADQSWWSKLANPPLDIGTQILSHIPNVSDLYWVDFTMEKIWPRK